MKKILKLDIGAETTYSVLKEYSREDTQWLRECSYEGLTVLILSDYNLKRLSRRIQFRSENVFVLESTFSLDRLIGDISGNESRSCIKITSEETSLMKAIKWFPSIFLLLIFALTVFASEGPAPLHVFVVLGLFACALYGNYRFWQGRVEKAEQYSFVFLKSVLDEHIQDVQEDV